MKGKFVTNEFTPHLGGNFADIDPACWCPTAWSFIIDHFGVQSVLDVGSGRGHAAKWFSEKNLKVFAIEGLKENVDNSSHPSVLHDLTTSSYIFSETIDLVNCIEVVEHIEEQFLENLLETLCQGKYLLMTHAVPGQPGWHHVNCQQSDYWINHIEKKGYSYNDDLSIKIRELANKDEAIHIARNGMIFQKIK
jgi:SAM-dependent methyltransferase